MSQQKSLSNLASRHHLILGLMILGLTMVGCGSAAQEGVTGALPDTAGTAVEQLESPPLFGIAVTENLTVIDVFQGLAADRAGVQRGDKVLALNEITVSRGRDAASVFPKQAIKQRDDQKPSVLSFERNGKRLTSELRLAPPGLLEQVDDADATVGPTPTPAVGIVIYYL